MDEEDTKEYRWETGYEKTWESVTEDSSGRIEASVAELVAKNKRKRLASRCDEGVRLGIMRHVFFILDMSTSMTGQDLKPSRHLCLMKILEEFIPEFHEQNPISQLGIIVTQNKMATKFSELANNPHRHLEKLAKLREMAPRGEPSLQNALELAVASLVHLPPHTSREVVILYAALTSCDPGEIQTTIAKVEAANIRVSVVGLAAELFICKQLSEKTGGGFSVCLNDAHLRDLVREQLEPPAATEKLEHTLIKVGFPHQVTVGAKAALCMCHLDTAELSTRGYFCPQCGAKYCELPAECKVCSLMLVTAPHLARSYRHLFPLKMFAEVECGTHAACYGCMKPLDARVHDQKVYSCTACQSVFCSDCDLFLHEHLHTCPGCASDPALSALM